MNARTVDTTQFRGDGAIFALVLAFVRRDYWHSPKGSRAFETAKKFLDGGECVHEGVVYDWGQHRDLIVGSLGMETRGFVKAVKSGRQG